MTSGECFENKWLYMKYIGKYLSAEILLTREYIALIHNFFFSKLPLCQYHTISISAFLTVLDLTRMPVL